MKLGFLSASLGNVPLDRLAAWAAEQGFDALELAAWRPPARTRDYAPRHVEAERLTRDGAERIRAMLDEHGLTVSALAYYENPLHPNPRKREAVQTHLRRVIDAAGLLGVPYVGTFVGARPVKPATVLREAGALFRGLVAHAEDRGVRLMIENCPMENWVRFGLPGNYAYSPELWEALFEEVPSPSFGLNYDPSHLVWLGIDIHRAARDFASRIFHVHAKDTEVLEEGKYRHGVLAEQLGDNPWHSGWWRYRMPGRGQIDWRAFAATLREIGYDGTISIEHEDPDYEGSEERVKEGLRLGLTHLERSVVRSEAPA